MQRQHVAIAVKQRQLDRNRQRRSRLGCSRPWRMLRQRQRVLLPHGIVAAVRLQPRRAGLAVPGQVRRQVGAVGIAERPEKILQRGRVPVVALEVQIHAAAKTGRAQGAGQHAHQFGALLVHRGGIEVVDLAVLRRAYRMRQRAGVFRKLRAAQQRDILDALQRCGVHVGREALLAEHREPFLQRELEPVAAGHPVAAPVVEVLVGNHRLDVAIFIVRGRVRVGQQALRIEDVESLVLHRAHVEIVGGNDVEHVKVVIAAKRLLVPAHRAFKRIHGVMAAVDGVRFGPDLQLHCAPFGGDVVAFDLVQPAGDQREEIARFRMRVDKARPVPAALQFAAAVGIAAGQQHREARAIGAQGHAVARLHVGSVGKERDVAKTLGFALGQQETCLVRAGKVQPFQRGVRPRPQAHAGFQHAAIVRPIDLQHVAGVAVRGGRQLHAIECDRQQLQVFAVQPQWQVLRDVPPQQQARGEFGGLDAEIEIELDRLDPPGRRAVVTQMDQRRGLLWKCVHGAGQWGGDR